MFDSAWWQRAVIYQIYPRSFQDSDGDGIGDLRGIESRLPYLRDLGIDAIWISPIFPSPMADFGYDIADYENIDPLFGNLTDFDALLHKAHALDLKVIIDLVPNHTSDQHPWFLESRASRHSPKRDWYIWRDPAPDGGVPNNWLSEFGGSTWQYDEATGQYYQHAFLAAQPDLNWRNPAVRAAMFEIMRFWLRRGVDGFRVDVIWHLIKDAEFRDNPPNPNFVEGQPLYRSQLALYSADRPEVHDVIADMRRIVDEFPDRLLIGEIYLPIERLVTYYGRNLDGVHMPFNFSLIETPWRAQSLADLIGTYEAALPPGGWPNFVLGNHDRARIASRVGPLDARLAALLLLTLRGTPTIYYGDEIGMEQGKIPLALIRDPFELNVPGHGLGRDGCRTPMQWDDTEYAGFSQGEPWLPLNENFIRVNVAHEQKDPLSIHQLYRRLIALRKNYDALMLGSYRLATADRDLFVFLREYHGQTLLIALNFAAAPALVGLPQKKNLGRLLLSTFADRGEEKIEDHFHLRPKEGAILQILARE